MSPFRITEAEKALLEYLRSGVTFEEVSESHDACLLIIAVCDENIRKRIELVYSKPVAGEQKNG